VVDSRHGRIAGKVCLSSCIVTKSGKRTAASNQPEELGVQPRAWLAAALESQFFFIVLGIALAASSGNIRVGS
jgi:hypothetical protein